MIRLKTASFSVVTLEVLDTGATEMVVEAGGSTAVVQLLPEELGMLLTEWGNSMSDGRAEEVGRMQEHILRVEKRKEKDGNRIH